MNLKWKYNNLCKRKKKKREQEEMAQTDGGNINVKNEPKLGPSNLR